MDLEQLTIDPLAAMDPTFLATFPHRNYMNYVAAIIIRIS
jgi:hypothetical protein